MLMLDSDNYIPQFGKRRSSRKYTDRYVVYGIGFNRRGKVLLAKARGKFTLPGGGIYSDESAKQALKREVLEETGWHVKVIREICRANEWTYSNRKRRYMNKIARFYLIRPISKKHKPIDRDHEGKWVTYTKAARDLKKEFHRWALFKCLS